MRFGLTPTPCSFRCGRGRCTSSLFHLRKRHRAAASHLESLPVFRSSRNITQLCCSVLVFFAALIHRDRRTYFRSAAPWFAILACGLVATPHLIWVVQHHYQPFLYALSKKGHPDAKFVDTWLGFLVICALYHVLQLAVVAGVKLAERVRDIRRPSSPSSTGRHSWPSWRSPHWHSPCWRGLWATASLRFTSCQFFR